MNLEQQVCSPILADRIKELGLKKESTWYWFKGRLILGMQEGFNMRVLTPAYTVAELGEMLPDHIEDSIGTDGWLEWEKLEGAHRIIYADAEGEDYLPNVEANTEADARAKMLIYRARRRAAALPCSQGARAG
jgi:hypothetical protein